MVNKAKRLSGINPLAYMGVEPITPSLFMTENRAPTPNDYEGFNLGTTWLDTLNHRVYMLTNLLAGHQAVWTLLAAGGTGANTFITDVGGPVNDLFGTLSILGVANELSTDGTVANTVSIGFVTNPIVQGLLTTHGGLTADNGSDVTIAATGNLNMPDSDALDNGVINFGGIRFIANFGNAGASHNTFVGNSAGNPLVDNAAIENTGIGWAALTAIDHGSFNVALGALTGDALTDGDYNTLLGQLAGTALVDGDANTLVGALSGSRLITGSNNSTLGVGSLDQLLTGSNNIAIGLDAANAYTTVESSNIIIGNTGTILDDNVIRIGTQGGGVGQQDACYIAGIYQAVVGGVNEAVIIDNNGKLGSMPIGDMIWSREPGAAVALDNHHGYINTNAGLTTFTLPLLADIGDVIEIIGEGAGQWIIAQNAGQNIQFANVSTTPGVGGSVAASDRYDCITLRCRVANTTWSVVANVGGPFNIV